MPDKESLRKKLRSGDISLIFKNVPENIFSAGLELGAGDGFQSSLLQKYVKKLTATDLEPWSPAIKTDDVAYLPMAASDIDRIFGENSLDLIYSSNVLEHVEDIGDVILKMRKVLKNEGVMIHIMPNINWKILQYIFFVPSKLRSIRARIFKTKKDYYDKPGFLDGAKKIPELFPSSHGGQVNTFMEFILFSRMFWRRVFEKKGFEIISIRKLQFHSPYRLGCPEILRKILAAAGMSTSSAYVLKKKGFDTTYEKYFKNI